MEIEKEKAKESVNKVFIIYSKYFNLIIISFIGKKYKIISFMFFFSV